MFKTKKRIQELEKRVADLEGQVQSQQQISASEIEKIISKSSKCYLFEVGGEQINQNNKIFQ